MRGIDEWFTGEDESMVAGVGEGAQGSAAAALRRAHSCLEARPREPVSPHRPFRLLHAVDPASARLSAAWFRACLLCSLRMPLPCYRPTPPRAALAPPRYAPATAPGPPPRAPSGSHMKEHLSP